MRGAAGTTRIVTIRERSLRRALQQYVVHYHEERNHQGKENLILFPLKREGARDRKAAVRCRERLGGLLKYYEREAA
jgi:hypothetical protein